MKLVISLILNVVFAIALIDSFYSLRQSKLELEAATKRLESSDRNFAAEKNTSLKLLKENDEINAALEKNIAARSRLEEMLAEAKRLAKRPHILRKELSSKTGQLPIPASLLSERTAKKPATKPNASQEQ